MQYLYICNFISRIVRTYNNLNDWRFTGKKSLTLLTMIFLCENKAKYVCIHLITEYRVEMSNHD